MYPKSFQKLIDHFASLPSVGPKMAERLVLYLFKQDKDKIKSFAENLEKIKDLKNCHKCYNIAEGDICEICKNSKRDQKMICVVEEPLDIISIERTNAYNGLYHVLGGTIGSPINKETDLRIPELLKRIKNEKIKEIILAFNPTTEGDTTSLYLRRKLQSSGVRPHTNSKKSGNKPDLDDDTTKGEIGVGVKITKLAKGLSTGGDIEYADEATLSAALTNRKELV